MEAFETIKNTFLFENVPHEYLKSISGKFTEVKYDEDTVLFHEDDEPDYFYVIVEGSAVVILNIEDIGDEEVAILKKNDYFGEVAFLDDGLRSAKVIAKKGSQLLKLEKDAFLNLLNQPLPIANIILYNMIKKASERIRSTSDKLNSFYLMDMSI